MFKDKLKKLFNSHEENFSKEYSEKKAENLEENRLSKENNSIEGNNKKKIENLVFLIIVLIITVVAINYIWNGKEKSNNVNEVSKGKQLATAKSIQSSDKSSAVDNVQTLEKNKRNGAKRKRKYIKQYI